MSKYLNEYSGNKLEQELANFTAQRQEAKQSRRRFLSTLAAVGAVSTTGLVGCSDAGQLTPTPTSSTPSVVDVLNFALNLEYLEASFYLYVTTGSGLSATDMGSGAGTVSGGAQVTFSNSIVTSAAAQLATDEREHVEFLRTTIGSIGGTAVAMPTINLAAGGAVTNDATFLAAARQLEAVGVSAYIGGAQYLTSNTSAVLYASQILDTEAQHAGFIRELCIALGVTSAAVDTQDMPPTATQIFNTNPMTGLNPVRTTSQVLQIVYGAAGKTGVSNGGFFPAGLNGNVRTS